jgi:hypothetical protein
LFFISPLSLVVTTAATAVTCWSDKAGAPTAAAAKYDILVVVAPMDVVVITRNAVLMLMFLDAG